MAKAYAHARTSENLQYEAQPRFRDLVVMLDDLGFDYVGNLDQCHAEDGHGIHFDAVFRQRHMKTLERHVPNIIRSASICLAHLAGRRSAVPLESLDKK